VVALLGAAAAHAAAQPDPAQAEQGALGLVQAPVRPLGLLLDILSGPRPKRSQAPLPLAAVSASMYEQTTSPTELGRQGCTAGRRNAGGLTILDFGRPSWNGHSYGTILFSNRFASNKAITRALWAFAVAYVRCLPRQSERRIVLARGTSNYGISGPSPRDAGRAWARETHRLGRLFARHTNLAAHVSSAAADDMEPAWDVRFRRTRGFLRGFRSFPSKERLYNFGSLDGGGVWTVTQAYYATVKGNTRVVPQIYSHEMARQWAELARSGLRRYHRALRFAGVITQHRARCGCSLEPHDARRVLQRALALHVGRAAPDVPPTLTNIVY
jgi:hypothetical protein